MDTQTVAGALEILGISGVALARGADALGMRLACPHPALGLGDDKDVLLTLDRPAAHAPDQSYVRYGWHVPVTPDGVRRLASRPRQSINAPVVVSFAPGEAARVTLEWSFDGAIVSARYSSDGPVRAALIVNGCFAPARVLAASPAGCELGQGGSRLRVVLTGTGTGSPWLLNHRDDVLRAWVGMDAQAGEALACYPVTLAPDQPLYVTLALVAADAPMPELPARSPQAIDAVLAAGAAAYEQERMRSSGACRDAAEAVAALAGYSRAYDPRRRRVQTTVNRTWGGPNSPGLVFGWDNFFTSYLASWEDPALGAASLEHSVGVYSENGIAHGPVQRNLIIPVLYCRTLDVLGDEALARRTWPGMMQFMRFWFADRGDGRPWRDGNDDGLIESGTCADPRHTSPGRLISDAMDETGYDDYPVYSAGFTDGRLGLLADGVSFDYASRCLDVTLVCQNSLYVTACRAMARRADALSCTTDAAWLRGEAGRVAQRMRERLYAQDQGLFRDRRADGSFSPVTGMTLFYPLLAELADAATQQRLQRILLDPKQFWGRNLIPTVSRSDPAYCDGLDGRGNYWRGNCWPPTTYIVYLALKEAGWDEIAAEYVRRVHTQFMTYWRRHGHAYENYPAAGDVDHDFLYVQLWGGREVRYAWAGAMPMCGLEELFAPEPLRPGVRFGNPHLARQARWGGFRYAGQRMEAEAGPRRTRVRCGDQWEFVAEPGVAVRGFALAPEGGRCAIRAAAAAQVRLRGGGLPPGSGGGVWCDGHPQTARRDAGWLVTEVPVGTHDLRWA